VRGITLTVSGTEIGTLTTAPLIPHCLSYPRDIMRMKGIRGEIRRSSRHVKFLRHSGISRKSKPLERQRDGTP